MTRVLLTGGYGCIGTWIVRNLLQRGDEVFIYDRNEDVHRLDLILAPEQIQRVRVIPGDVTDLPRPWFWRKLLALLGGQRSVGSASA